MKTTLIGLALLASLIGGIIIYPFHQNLRGQALAHFQGQGEAIAAHLHSQIRGMQDLAVQVTSRTQARALLMRYNQGELDRDSARAALNDILSDVPRRSAQVLGVWRFDAGGRPLAGIGLALPPQLSQAPRATQGPQLLGFRPEQGPLQVLVDAPIQDREQNRVGNDLVLFSGRGLEEGLRQALQDLPQGQLRLLHGTTALFDLGASPQAPDGLHSTRFAIGDNGLSLHVGIPEGQLYRLANRQSWRLGLLLLALVALGGTAILLLGRRFARTLNGEMQLRQQREQDLLASEQRFRALVQSSSLAMLVMDDSAVGHIGLVNHRFSELFGYPASQIRTLDDWWQQAYPDADKRRQVQGRWHEALQRLDQLAAGDDPRTTPIISKAQCADGSKRIVELSMSRQHGFSLLVFNDLTQERQLQKQLQLAASVFSHASEGIVITDPDARILDVNQAFCRITGYQRSDVIGENPRLLKSGRHDPLFYKAMWADLLELGHWTGEIWNRRKSGEIFVELLSISAVYDHEQQLHHYVGLFSDVTQAREHQDKLERIAHYDALTGLPNRTLLADRMQQAMLQTQRRNDLLAVVFLDLDGFKEINDQHGHEAGDELLITLSRRLHDAVREGDSLARLGGDEFVALLIDIHGKHDVEPLLDRLLAAAAQPVHLGRKILQVSASLGVSFYPQGQPVSAEQLLKQADSAMYLAKQSGKNRYRLFDAERDRHLQGRHEPLSRIHQALKQRELLLHYQPKVNLYTGKVLGVEALLRWQHPQRGLLLPDAFLAIAREQPLAIDIDLWVMRTALAQLALWHQAGLRLRLSVNVGAQLLQQDDFVHRVANLLQEAGIVGRWLEIEIEEGLALEDIHQAARLIEQCRAIDVGFALDDFGTGYSSLTYLKRLSADTLKIDQGFVRDMLDDPDALSVLEGVLGLASAFGREAVAEGAETQAHCSMLLRLGCELAQGHGISRPLPAEQLADWVKAWRPNPEWRDIRPVNRLNQPLLAAAIRHRAWVRQVQDYIASGGKPPSLHAQDCPFQEWVERDGREHFSALDSFQATQASHHQLHDLGQQICQLASIGQRQQAEDLLPQLKHSRDQLLTQLEQLIQATH
ncbi:MAG: EAL domain-containing protein [Gammaproteobacteria bacterium SHHR-1]